MTPSSYKKHYRVLFVINLLALGIALHLLHLHFRPELGDVCNLGERWNCDIVNKSIYSTLFGLPVAGLGAATYFFLVLFSLRGLYVDQKKAVPWVFAGLTGALAFSLYLTAVEAFVLQTFCIFCMSQQVLILLEYGVFISLLNSSKSQ
ncbi:vitamin K epoxide reductase family protein [Candidatus Peregrinibacteria bacterium]|nr:MAG: vitamin K epoxide reductase family protein [Candidatus Peregrinibacteria bacterium]